MKDPQRELNKRRIQTLHLLNTSANGGDRIEETKNRKAATEDLQAISRINESLPEVDVK